jgi:hypothetical protein
MECVHIHTFVPVVELVTLVVHEISLRLCSLVTVISGSNRSEYIHNEEERKEKTKSQST